MSYFSSSQFASSAATGNDWREVAKTVLEDLSDAKTDENSFNFGFLYISDMLAEDAESILNLFKSVLNIDNWVGGIGIGICANGKSFIDKPAISAMVGTFEDTDFCLFPPINQDPEKAAECLEKWLEDNDPMLVLTTGDPMSEEDPAQTLRMLEAQCSGFMVGGLTSSRKNHAQFAGGLYNGGLCGAVFSQSVKVASTLSQGCTPIGTAHTITKCDGHEIHTLDDRDALEVFEDDLRSMVIKKIDRDPDTIQVDEAALTDPKELPEDFHSLIKGEVHAALPVSESDQNDFLVRNIIGINNDDNAVVISQHVSNGDRVMFVYRDHDSVYEDLSAQLLELRERVQNETGTFEPKGAIYISCAARAFNEFEDGSKNEMQLINEIIGDVPLTGFYAGGEINKARLYGYTGILTLFL
ncbi:MAG: FIST C-terminal domain-containing protein [Alphaproteobacteria bacterium]|nr:FIST C-terminal domain-containing protein [Alphaproteobacteria bacterium]